MVRLTSSLMMTWLTFVLLVMACGRVLAEQPLKVLLYQPGNPPYTPLDIVNFIQRSVTYVVELKCHL